jgi:hypothetical protein
MFPISNPEFQLDLFHRRAEALHREAAAYRLAKEASGQGRHRRFGRWSRAAARPRPVRVPAVP